VTRFTAGAHGLSASASYLLAAGCLVIFIAVLWAVCGTKGYGPPQERWTRRRIWYVFLGYDDRVSTSKTQFALWILALAYALLVIAFHVGGYPSGTLSPSYLVLLGFPLGAAVGAKVITVHQIASGATSKNPSVSNGTLAKAIAEIVSADNGDLDLGDTQYFILTLVALIAFFIAFARDPVKLPLLPDTLIGLTSLSAAAYLAKKALPGAPNAVQAQEAVGHKEATGHAEPETGQISTSLAAPQQREAWPAESLRSKRLLIGLCTTTAMMLGLTPAALALHRVWLLPYVLIGSIVLASFSARNVRVFSSTQPTVREFLLATLNAVVLPALLGIVWLILYWAMFWLARLINHPHDKAIALALSLAFLFAAGVGVIWSVTRDLAALLYPHWGGSRTRYFYLTRLPWAAINVGVGALVLGAGVSAAALLTSSWTSTAVWVVILVFSVVAGAAVERLPQRQSPEDPRSEDVQAVGEALAEQGYRVVARPRTGKTDIDPLVQHLELFSYSGQRAYAVDIKHRSPGAEPLDWTAGTRVLDAARALERSMLAETIAMVRPLLVVFDGAADESLHAFCLGERVSLIRIDRANSASEVVSDDRSGDLQAIVHRFIPSAGPGSKPEDVAAAGYPAQGRPTSADLG
jgi:hypothetical protein